MLFGLASCSAEQSKVPPPPEISKEAAMQKSEEEWKQELGNDAYRVLRQKGTEPAFSGEYVHLESDGFFVCRGCGQKLFEAKSKFDSGSGWPSFYEAIDKDAITENKDVSHGMTRIEIVCSRCNGHLGHVFPDGPKPTGLRYCVNSLSLAFKQKKED